MPVGRAPQRFLSLLHKLSPLLGTTSVADVYLQDSAAVGVPTLM